MYILQVVLLVLVAVSSATCKAECPLWTTFNNTTGKCECGSDLAGVVTCNPDTLEISILRCYCMTYDEHTDTTEVGPCYFTCDGRSSLVYEVVRIYSNNSLELNHEICGPFKELDEYVLSVSNITASQFILFTLSVHNAQGLSSNLT